MKTINKNFTGVFEEIRTDLVNEISTEVHFGVFIKIMNDVKSFVYINFDNEVIIQINNQLKQKFNN